MTFLENGMLSCLLANMIPILSAASQLELHAMQADVTYKNLSHHPSAATSARATSFMSFSCAWISLPSSEFDKRLKRSAIESVEWQEWREHSTIHVIEAVPRERRRFQRNEAASIVIPKNESEAVRRFR